MRQLFSARPKARNLSARNELQAFVLNFIKHDARPFVDISPIHILAYQNFLTRHRHESSSTMLTLLRSHETMTCSLADSNNSQSKIPALIRNLREHLVPYQEIMRTHIAICNSLARNGLRFFWTRDMVSRCLNSTHATDPRKCWRSQGYWTKVKVAAISSLSQPELMGVCTNDVQPGDKVLLIAGLFMPIVVRSHGETYRIISPVIIPGVMQGQAWYCRMKASDEDNLMYFKIS